MSVELLDKGVSTDENESGGGISSADFARLQAVLSALVENKVVAIREDRDDRRRIFKRFRTRSDGNSVSTVSSVSPKKLRRTRDETSTQTPPTAAVTHHQQFIASPSVPPRLPIPQQSFDSFEASRHSDSCCCSQQIEAKSKHLSTTEEWLNAANSRQASTETATTSSGYISPASGGGCMTSKKADVSEDGDEEDTIVAGCPVSAMPECPPDVSCPTADDACYHCSTTICLPPLPPHHHLHPAGGHYVSCCNSPSHSETKIQYDDNYLTLAINLEDVEFEREEERRKRRKRRKKRRKERQARARGLMADELKSMNKCNRVIDPDDLPKRARWTIVATACVLLLMALLLVGVTLRMAPIIDDMVRRDNEQRLNSINRHETSDVSVNETRFL